MNDQRLAALDDRDWMTVVEVATLLGVSEKTVRARIADGTIPHWRLGPRTIRIPRDALGQRPRPRTRRRD